MADHFDVIIIGTGFGATVLATELIVEQHRQIRICMLERGVWWFTPERPFPPYIQGRIGTAKAEPIQYWPRPDHRDGVINLLSAVRTNNRSIEAIRDLRDQPQPLFRYNSFDEVDIMTASGVGGGSLVYSNVTIEPHFDGAGYPVMENWPMQLTPAHYAKAYDWMTTNRGRLSQIVTKFPVPANLAAQLNNLPATHQDIYLGRSRWLKDAAAEMQNMDAAWQSRVLTNPKTNTQWSALDLQVFEYNDDPSKTNLKNVCERQGRCFMGCLPGARHTLNKTLIDPNRNLVNGANPPVELRALADVDFIRKLPNNEYEVLYEDLHFGDDDDGRQKSVTAPVVIVAAGALGSTRLLLRSQKKGNMKFSAKLGRGFSTNGDGAGFVRYTPQAPPKYPIYTSRGPINTSHVMFEYQNEKIFVNVEDAGIPPMLATTVKKAIEVFANAASRDPFIRTLKAIFGIAIPNPADFMAPMIPPEHLDNPQDFQTESEAMQNTFFFNTMGRDKATGVFGLDDHDELTLTFPNGLTNDPVYEKADEIMNAMARAMKGEYVRFPFWARKGQGFVENKFTRERKMITVHPLGGCGLANSAADGTVDTQGRVFDSAGGVHNGFYVADAAIIPGPLAVNPTLTIVALAKEIASKMP